MSLQAHFGPGGFLEGEVDWPRGVHALMGPSGSGKTTLLRHLAGLGEPGPAVTLDGSHWQATAAKPLPPYRRPVAYVPQHPSLVPFKTIASQIAWIQPGKSSAAPPVLDVSALLSRFPKELSGGQQQQVALARALAADQTVLLLDESLSQVDQNQRRRIMQWLGRARPAPWIVFSTHQLSEALQFSDTVTVIQEGRIFAAKTPDLLLQSPDNPAMARFLGYCGSFPAGDGRHLLVHPARTLIGAYPGLGLVLEADVHSVPGPGPLERRWSARRQGKTVSWQGLAASPVDRARAITLIAAAAVPYSLESQEESP